RNRYGIRAGRVGGGAEETGVGGCHEQMKEGEQTEERARVEYESQREDSGRTPLCSRQIQPRHGVTSSWPEAQDDLRFRKTVALSLVDFADSPIERAKSSRGGPCGCLTISFRLLSGWARTTVWAGFALIIIGSPVAGLRP